MTILLLVRHASNDYLKEGRLAGWIPGIHINAQGQREADATARRLAHIPIHAIYSSPLERAVDTAKAIAGCQHLDVQIREELGEGRVGDWAGKTIKELEQTDEWKQMVAHPVGFHPVDGESIDEIQARMAAAVGAIVAAHPNQVVAVVSHADPIKALIAHYLRMDLSEFNRLTISPASVTVFSFGERGPMLVRLNDSDQLPAFKPEKPKHQENNDEGKEQLKMADPNILYDLNPVSRITVAAVGKPGKRTFYIQAGQGRTVVTLVMEKEQVAALSRGIDEMLERLGGTTAPFQVMEVDMDLVEPIEPLFRIGQLGLGYDMENKLIVLVAYAITDEENAEAAADVVRFWAKPEQARALARHAASIISAGRPICVLCGRPIDPEGHFCPKRNGHGEKAALG